MSLFKESLHPFVYKQLAEREAVLTTRLNGTSSNQQLAWLTAKTAWARMSSAVDVVDDKLARILGTSKGSKLAHSHVMMGGELYQTGDTTYRQRAGIGDGGGAYGDAGVKMRTNSSGFRPMAGLHSLSVQSKGTNNSLRTLSLAFSVWTKEEFDRLEVLYSRPGYSVLIEWGWSVTPSGEKPSYFNILDNPPTKEVIFDELYRVAGRDSMHAGPKIGLQKPGFIEARNGNYDAFYGLIKNFNWETDSNTMGYKVTIEVVSIAEVLESFNLNYVSKLDSQTFLSDPLGEKIPGNYPAPNRVDSTLSRAYLKSKFVGILTQIKQQEAVSSLLTNVRVNPQPDGTIYYGLYQPSFHASKDPYFYFIRLRDLVDILNKHIVVHTETGPLVKFSCDDRDGNPLEGFAHYFQSSADVLKCVNKPTTDNRLLLDSLRNKWLDGSPAAYDWFVNDGKYNRSIIGNLLINVDYLIEQMGQMETSNTGAIDIVAYFNEILKGCSIAMGGINDLALYADPVLPTIYIVDRAYVEDDTKRAAKYQFKLDTPLSIVRKAKMRSTVFPSQSSMIAIGAQAAGGGSFGIDTTSFDQFNRGLEDRIMRLKGEAGTIDTVLAAEQDRQRRSQLSVTADSLYQYNRILNKTGRTNDLSIIDPPTTALHDLIIMEIDEQIKSGCVLHSGRAILPITLEIELDGIAGIQIGQLFTVVKTYLPASYSGVYDDLSKSRLGFIIKGVSHRITESDWTTLLESQTVILDSELSKVPVTQSILMQQLHIFVSKNGKTTQVK